MKYRKRGWIKQIMALLILILIAIGCTATPSPQANVPQANLTAREIGVKVSSGGDAETDLQKDGSIDVRVDDRIRLDGGGLGLLRFQDRIDVELFPNTEIQLDDAQQESGGSTFVRLDQIQGHTHVILSRGALARLTLETELATATTLEQGTEFMVCHAPGVTTCLAVREGSVEFTSEGESKIYKAGESSFVKPGETPPPPVCIPPEEINQWLSSIQAAEEVPALGELVAQWSQEPCPTSVQTSPTVEVPQLPASTGMVKIDAGAYQIGSPEADEFHIASQEITLPAYWIDVYEITNAEYQQFLDATGWQPPEGSPGAADHPVSGVTWDAAAAYCAWANKRLPVEAEWEVAARGPGQDPPLFPWGSDPFADGEVNELPRDQTYAVGTYSFNQSDFGVYDMAGNVWEWVDEPYEEVAEGARIIRGGRYGFIRDAAYRQPAQPNDGRFVPFAGFRCAADQVQGE